MHMTTKIMLEKEILILLTVFGPQSILPFSYFHTGTFLIILPMKPLIFFLSNCCWHSCHAPLCQVSTAVAHSRAAPSANLSFWKRLFHLMQQKSLLPALQRDQCKPSQKSSWGECEQTIRLSMRKLRCDSSFQPGLPGWQWPPAKQQVGSQGSHLCSKIHQSSSLNMEPWSWHQWESSSDWREK